RRKSVIPSTLAVPWVQRLCPGGVPGGWGILSPRGPFPLSAARMTRDNGSASDHRSGERLVGEHDRNVRDDGVDEARGGAVETLLDHRLFVAEMLAVLLHQVRADLLRQLDELELALRLRADKDVEQLLVNGHDPLLRVGRIPRGLSDGCRR